MLVLVLAAIQPRPEPDRDGVLKTQSAPAQDRRQNIYRYVQRPRGDMRPLLPAGMLELLQGCRICLRLKVGCFSRFGRCQLWSRDRCFIPDAASTFWRAARV